MNTKDESLAQPEQEPVAFYHPRKGFYWAKPTSIFAPTAVDVKPFPLYTTLPSAQRPWQGLTEENAIELLPVGDWEIESTLEFAKAIEAKLKERNT
jgi:hypothetical protein